MSARLSHRLRKPAAPWRPMTLALAAALLAVAAVMTVTMTMTTRAALAAEASAHPKPSEDQLLHSGYRFAGEKFEDKFPELPGDETNIRIFKKGQEVLGLYILPSGQVYGFAVKVGNQPLTAYIDEYNTGYCQKDFGDGESFRIDFPSYRAEPGYTSGRKGSLRKK